MVTCANYENNCFRSLLFIKNSILNIDSLQGIDAIMIIDMINFTMQVRWALWSYSLWMLHYSSLCKGLIMWSLNINLGSWDFWYHRASFVLVMKKFTNTSQVSCTIQKPTFRPSVLFTVLEYVNMVYLYVALFSFYVHIMCSLVDRERVALINVYCNMCTMCGRYFVYPLVKMCTNCWKKSVFVTYIDQKSFSRFKRCFIYGISGLLQCLTRPSWCTWMAKQSSKYCNRPGYTPFLHV